MQLARHVLLVPTRSTTAVHNARSATVASFWQSRAHLTRLRVQSAPTTQGLSIIEPIVNVCRDITLFLRGTGSALLAWQELSKLCKGILHVMGVVVKGDLLLPAHPRLRIAYVLRDILS